MAKFTVRHGSVTVNFDDSALKSKIYNAQKVLAYQIIADCRPYTPGRNDHLANSAHPEDDYTAIVWDRPYSQFQWYGNVMVGIESKKVWANKGEKKELTSPLRKLRYSTKKNSKATSFWFESAKRDNLDKWIATVAKAVE